MTASTLSSGWLLVAAVVALPFVGGGCGREACFTWTTAEGMCPARSDALAFFSNPKCPGKVTSVESEGTSELDGTLCCYQVISRAQSDEASCQGFGGASSESVGFAASTGSVGSGPSCAHCGDTINTAPSKPICPESQPFIDDFVTCACSESCASDCGDNLCVSTPTSMACFTCLEDPTGCQSQFSACSNDI
ncbi:MAG: hypothetical protein ABJE95_23155 [Byssovorax sp.]